MFSSTICRSKFIIPVLRRPVYVVNFLKNFEFSIIMPPKRKVTAKKVEVEEITNDVPKKRGKKTDQEPVEAADSVVPAEQEKKSKKPAAKPETKPETKPGKNTKKAAEEKTKAEEKPIKAVKEKAKLEEKVEKMSTRTKSEKADENKEKPTVRNQKQGSSVSVNKKGTKEKVKAEKVTKAKSTAPKKTEKAPTATKKTEAKPALLNVTASKWDEIDFGCKKQNPNGDDFNLKITSWNVDGLRAWLKKDGINILKYDKPDILCLQETKCSDEKLPDEVKGINGYYDYWCSSNKEGYAGVGIYTKKEPLNVKDGIDAEQHDDEGRCLTLEFTDFYLVNVYVPNAGRGLITLDKRLEWNEAFKAYIKELDCRKPVILCGDMNVAHNEIDLSNPKTNKKNAGFTQEERDGMTDFLGAGYVDSYRELYPEQLDVYTFWSYMNKARSKNIGWRLDYFILSKRIMENVCDNVARTEVYGSDHCPITLFINI